MKKKCPRRLKIVKYSRKIIEFKRIKTYLLFGDKNETLKKENIRQALCSSQHDFRPENTKVTSTTYRKKYFIIIQTILQMLSRDNQF